MSRYLKIFSIAFALIVVTAYILVDRANEPKDGTIELSLKDYLLSTLLNELPSINARLPYQIDANTKLLSIEYVNSKVVSHYELLNGREAKLEPQRLSALTFLLQKQACLDESKKPLIDVGVEFLSKYADSKGKVILEADINKAICTQFSAPKSIEVK